MNERRTFSSILLAKFKISVRRLTRWGSSPFYLLQFFFAFVHFFPKVFETAPHPLPTVLHDLAHRVSSSRAVCLLRVGAGGGIFSFDMPYACVVYTEGAATLSNEMVKWVYGKEWQRLSCKMHIVINLLEKKRSILSFHLFSFLYSYCIMYNTRGKYFLYSISTKK